MITALIIKSITVYQFFTKDVGLLKNRCVFTPSCSDYAKSAFIKYGFFKGFWYSVKRISKCHPWQHNHYDPLY